MHKIAAHQVKLTKDPERSRRFNYFLQLNSQYSKKYVDDFFMKFGLKNIDYLFGGIYYHLDSFVNKAIDGVNNEAERQNALDFDYEGSTRASFNSDCREDDTEVSVKDICEKLIWKDIWRQRLMKFEIQA